MLIYIWVVYNKLYKRHFMPIFSQDCLIYLCICKGCMQYGEHKSAKKICLAACDLYKGHVYTLMLHTLMLWVTWIQNFNVVTLLFRDMLQTKLQTHFLSNLRPWKRSHDFARLSVMGHKHTKFEILIFTDIWSRQYLGPPPDPGKNNNHTVIQLWVKNDTC